MVMVLENLFKQYIGTCTKNRTSKFADDFHGPWYTQ